MPFACGYTRKMPGRAKAKGYKRLLQPRDEPAKRQLGDCERRHSKLRLCLREVLLEALRGSPSRLMALQTRFDGLAPKSGLQPGPKSLEHRELCVEIGTRSKQQQQLRWPKFGTRQCDCTIRNETCETCYQRAVCSLKLPLT